MKISHWCLVAGFTVVSSACGKQAVRTNSDPLGSYNPAAVAAGGVRDFRPIYHRMGLAAAPSPIAFVGSSATFASSSADSTFVVASISIPNRGLTFERDGDQYKATYEATILVRQDTTVVRRESGTETVRVGTFKEVGRTDESIVFREAFMLPPGHYSMSYIVRDVIGSRDAGEDAVLNVPRYSMKAGMPGSSLSKPVIVYDATPRTSLAGAPKYLASPRASAEFGVDSILSVYIEAYGNTGSGNVPVVLALRDSARSIVWIDTVQLKQNAELASGFIDVPLEAADIGIWGLSANRLDIPDTTRSYVFVGFGPDLPVLTFGDMIGYLRFFAPNRELQALYDATPETRGAVWTAFLRATDRSPATPQNESLQEYFLRIREANYRFRGEGPDGWLTDRGSTYVGLGEPTAMYQEEGYLNNYSINAGQKVRVQIWEYQSLQARLVFVDEMWSGQWRFLPSSASQFRSLLARVVSIR